MAENVYTVQEKSLIDIADAIRTKAGKDESEKLAFPKGFVSAIEDIIGGNGNITSGFKSESGNIEISYGASTDETLCTKKEIELSFNPKIFYLFYTTTRTSESIGFPTSGSELLSCYYFNINGTRKSGYYQTRKATTSYVPSNVVDMYNQDGYVPDNGNNGDNKILMKWQGNSSVRFHPPANASGSTAYYQWIAIG